METKLKGKTAVITGGSSGIGLAAARIFSRQGASVVILGRDKRRLWQTAEELGSEIVPIQANVSNIENLQSAIVQAAEICGGIDILFANAGVSEAPPLAETTEADFDAMIGTNVKGVFFTVVHALPFLRTGASIILTGSVAAGKGRPGDPLYAASKGAVRSLGRTLAMSEELLARQIRVNVLTPGATKTSLTAAATEDPAIHDYVAAMVPMGRWGGAEEVARAALFLASEDSSYITGSEIVVDGGLANS